MSLFDLGAPFRGKAGISAQTSVSTTLSAGQKIIQSSGKKFRKGAKRTRRIYMRSGLM